MAPYASPMIPWGTAKIPRDAFHGRSLELKLGNLPRSTDVKDHAKAKRVAGRGAGGRRGGGFPGMVYSLLAIVHYSMNEVPE